MRGVYILIGLILIAVPTLACGLAIDMITDQQGRAVFTDKLPLLYKDGFKVSSPISVPLAILGSMFIARGITGRCIHRNKKAHRIHSR